MEADDADQVVEIEREAFATPWKAETFRTLLTREHVDILVLEEGEEIIAYAVLWCVGEHGELANLAVKESYRGRGHGSRMLSHIEGLAKQRGVRRLYLEVRVSNTRATGLYHARGFDEVGRRKAYYDRPKEDALVLLRRLS